MAHHKTKKAFTLAEVLITLGIIGIVAAMTIPALIANYQERVIVSQLKKYILLCHKLSKWLKLNMATFQNGL